MAFYGVCLLVVSLRPLQGLETDGPGDEDRPTVAWQKDYSQDDWTDERPCLIRSEDGGFYVVGISNRRAGESRFRYQLWIWKLSPRGERVWARTPEIPGLAESDPVVWSSCVCPEGERTIVAQESRPKTGAWLLRFDAEGAVTSCQALTLGRSIDVVRMVHRVPGGLLLCGAKLTQKSDAWVLKVDEHGKEVWQKTYDRGRSEAAIALDAAPDGSFAFAADSGEYNKFGGGPSEVWVVRCDAAGEIIAEATFEGRHPTIARSTDGSYAVSMNTEDFPALRMQILGLDETLQKTWGPHELAKGAGLGLYRIAVDERGDFIVAGSRMGPPCLWKLTRAGQRSWAFPIPTQLSCTLVRSLSVETNEYVLTAAGKDQGRDRPPDPAKADPHGHRDLSDILVVKVRAPE